MTTDPHPEPGERGITYQALLDTDTHPVPEVLRARSVADLGDADLPTDRYLSREWYELEVERLWGKVWQMACREEEIAHVGSYVVYDIAHLSFIVMRSGPDTIQAFYNSCLHRGRQLKDVDGRCSIMRCPYHGFAWALNGALADIPARWEFEHLDEEQFSLPEVQVGTWGGFVFINPDPGGRRSPSSSATSPPLRAMEPRGSLHPGSRPQGHPSQLEGGPGGVLRVLPRRGDASAGRAVPR
ncbi:MAG: Rieske (2Fe-2S) protein [Ilumatobacteraceae bacterium]